MGIKNLIIGVILASVFAFAMFSFGTQLGADNPSSVTLANDSSVKNLTDDLGAQYGVFETDVGGTSDALGLSQPEGEDKGTISAVFTGALTIVKAPFVIFGLLSNFINKQIGGVAFGLIFTVISSLIVVLIFLFVWQTFKSGQH